jgi:hypothetical protein
LIAHLLVFVAQNVEAFLQGTDLLGLRCVVIIGQFDLLCRIAH